MRQILTFVWVLCVVVAVAGAKPLALEPHEVGTVTISMPKGWTFSGDASKGTAIAQQDPKRKDAAQLLVVVHTSSSTEDQLIDTLTSNVAKGLKIVKRGSGPNGLGKLLVADGTVDGLNVRLGALAISANGVVVIGMLVATTGNFDKLGGTDLVVAVIASLKDTAQPATPAPAPAPAPAAVKDTVMPEQYDTYGELIVPPLTRSITIADLAGMWGQNDGAGARTSGPNGGNFDAVGIDQGWTIAANGEFSEVFKAAIVHNQSAHGVNQKSTGTVGFDRQGLLVIARVGNFARERYIVKGWFVGRNYTIMRLNGPHQDSETITDKDIANPSYNMHLNHLYIRKSAP